MSSPFSALLGNPDILEEDMRIPFWTLHIEARKEFGFFFLLK
jgi:hypothetical protein